VTAIGGAVTVGIPSASNFNTAAACAVLNETRSKEAFPFVVFTTAGAERREQSAGAAQLILTGTPLVEAFVPSLL
jgi:hypothetical protein